VLRPPAARSALQPDISFALYRAWGRFGLSPMRPAGTAMALLLIGIGAGGCSLNRFDGIFGKTSNDVTGSLGPAPQPAPAEPTETDLAFTRNAASDVLTRGDKDASQHWENPETGARGSVTPLAQAYSSDGRTCRDFLASYVNGSAESWLQGAGCRAAHGRWEIHTLKPWKQS
jgi:outer membrane surface antigen